MNDGTEAKDDDFEAKLERAKKILDQLVDPEIPLEKSVKLYKEGMATLKEAQAMIEAAKLEIETIEKEEIGRD